MNGFTREMEIYPSYDYRDNPDDGRGAHGCDLMLILRGDLGVITARISTGWMERPLTGEFSPGRAQFRRPQPGVDHRVMNIYPSGSYVGTHTPAQRYAYDLQQNACEYLDGAPCWGDGSYTEASAILRLLVTGGSDAAFGRLEALYQAWIVERPEQEDGL